MITALGAPRRNMTLLEKLRQVNVGLILLLVITASIGFVTLYSAAGGNLDPWASRQMTRFGIGLVLLLAVAVIDQRLWFRFAYAFYAVALVLLVAVELAGRIAGVPRSHLAMHKLVVNQVLLTMGLEQTQSLATLFDGITRHNPEGLWFRRYAQAEGFRAAVQWRDGGAPIPEGDEARELVRELEAKRGREGR